MADALVLEMFQKNKKKDLTFIIPNHELSLDLSTKKLINLIRIQS